MATVTLTSAVAGQVATAVFYNNNNNALLNQINGNLDATNLANLSVTGAKLASGAVSGPKIAMGSDAQGDVLYFNGTAYARLGYGVSGKALITKGIAANPEWNYPDHLSTIVGTTPSYSARAWVNFNGTGVVAIKASGNVTSITDNGTSDWTVNFTTAMPDVNYAVVATSGDSAALGCGYMTTLGNTTPQTVSLVRLTGSINADAAAVNVVVFR